MNVVEVKNAGKKEKGVFALKNFKKGEKILSFDRSRIFYDKDMDHMSRYALSHACHLGHGKNILMKSPEKYINHSCDPNTFDIQGNLFARKTIKKGQELTLDYALSGEEDWKMKCRCGSRKCRKNLDGFFSHLDKKTQRKYLPYLEKWYIRKNRKDLDRLFGKGTTYGNIKTGR